MVQEPSELKQRVERLDSEGFIPSIYVPIITGSIIIFYGLLTIQGGSLGSGLIITGIGLIIAGIGGTGVMGFRSIQVSGPVGLIMIAVGVLTS